MVRFKNRYIVLEVKPCDKKNEQSMFKNTALAYAVNKEVQYLYGHFGVAAIKDGFDAKYCNKYTKIAIVKTRHGPHKFVLRAIPLISDIGGQQVKTDILYVGATMKHCFLFIRKHQEKKLEQMWSRLQTENERKEMETALMTLMPAMKDFKNLAFRIFFQRSHRYLQKISPAIGHITHKVNTHFPPVVAVHTGSFPCRHHRNISHYSVSIARCARNRSSRSFCTVRKQRLTASVVTWSSFIVVTSRHHNEHRSSYAAQNKVYGGTPSVHRTRFEIQARECLYTRPLSLCDRFLISTYFHRTTSFTPDAEISVRPRYRPYTFRSYRSVIVIWDNYRPVAGERRASSR